VVESHPQAIVNKEAASLVNAKHVHGESQDCNTDDNNAHLQPATSLTTDMCPLTRTVTSLAITDTKTDSHSLIMHSAGMPENAGLPLSESNRLSNSYFNAIMSGQEMQAVSIKQSIDLHFDRLQTEMDKNKELQVQLIHTQQEMQQLQKSMDEKQDRVLEMQQQALDRLAIIQNKVQALLVQTYELHEYPIPRLFIVLPKDTGLGEKLTHLFSHQFRLYFLCECGTHTMTENSKVRHEIHLAKHDGYDLEKPTEFFERYGSYVLTLMHMIKYGITVAGFVVPPLASSGLVDGIDTFQKHLDHVNDIAPLVDDTIKFLNGIKRNTDQDEELYEGHTDLDQVEALEGADLRQLESYLKVKDQGRILGNLYRIVTQEGHVKWVCFDHYRATYHESMVQQLRDVIDVNKGTFIEEIGRIEITITSSVLARQFYQALVNARGIQELEITLEWDASMDDLRSLAGAVAKANVLHLSVDGTHLKSPALDIVNRGQRFDPILRLTSNARIQSLHLKGFDDFFHRISKSALVPAPKLRVFSLESKANFKDKTLKSFKEFLGHCSALASMELRLDPQDSIMTTSEILNEVESLTSLKVVHGGLTATACVSGGKIQDVNMAFRRFSDLSPSDIEFIQQGHFTRLTIKYSPQGTDERLLDDVLCHGSSLNHIQIRFQDRCVAIATTLGLTIHDLVRMATSDAPDIPDSFSVNCRRLSLTANYSQSRIHDMAITITHLADLSPEDLTFIKQNQYIRLAIGSPLKADEDRLSAILRHSVELSHLHIEHNEERHHVPTRKPQLGIQDLVKIVTSQTPGNLESLLINCGRFSASARLSQGRIHEVVMTIVQVGDLSSDDLKFIQQCHLAQLVIDQTPLKSDKARLTDILSHGEDLTHLQIGSKGDRRRAITIKPEMKLQEIVELTTSDVLCKLESLKIDWGDVSIIASISSGKIHDVDLTIKQVDDLSSGDLKFIQKDLITKLSIKGIKDITEDESRLNGIPTHYPKLGQLRIGCSADLCLSIVNSMISTRAGIVQKKGSSCLKTLEVMEDLIPFDMLDGKYHRDDCIHTILTFANDSNTFDMRSWIRLGDYYTDSSVTNFVRQYGWSTVSFYEGAISKTYTTILDEVYNTRESQLESLHMNQDVLMDLGLDHVNKIIERSPNFKDLGLIVIPSGDDTRIATKTLLDRHGKQLSMLRLRIWSSDYHMPLFASSFPSRSRFPNLVSFDLRTYFGVSSSDTVPSSCVPWIAAMISPPSPPSRAATLPASSSSSSQASSHPVETPAAAAAANKESKTESWTVLREVVFRAKFQPDDWRTLIDAIDFSVLEYLDLRKCNILLVHLKQIVDRVPYSKGSVAPLKVLVIKHTRVAKSSDSRALLDALRRKVPAVRIVEE